MIIELYPKERNFAHDLEQVKISLKEASEAAEPHIVSEHDRIKAALVLISILEKEFDKVFPY